MNRAWGPNDHGVWIVWTDHEGWGGGDMVFLAHPTGYRWGLHCTYTPFGMNAMLADEHSDKAINT